MSFIDERFFEHRRRSTSTAGIATSMAATLLWFYHYVADHVFRGSSSACRCCSSPSSCR
jgi:hypothetical protein